MSRNLFYKAHHQVFDPVVAPSGYNAPDDPYGIRRYAKSYISNCREKELITWVKDNVPNWEDDSLSLHVLGVAHRYLKDYSVAKTYLDNALEKRFSERDLERACETVVVLSEIHIAQNDNEGARRLLKEAVKLAPKHCAPHINLLCLSSLEKDESALKNDFNHMEEVYPEWKKDQTIFQRLEEDGELAFFRSTELWATLSSVLSDKE